MAQKTIKLPLQFKLYINNIIIKNFCTKHINKDIHVEWEMGNVVVYSAKYITFKVQ